MSDDNQKHAVDHAVDLLVYAPIGLFFEAPSLVPKLAEQGRLHARNARMIGQFAAQQGQAAVRRRASALEGPAVGLLRLAGLIPQPAPAPSPPPAATADATFDDPVPTEAAPEADELAIPDYDSLSASQVVARLPGLSSAELEGVRAYEAAHRGRRTILNKAAQLQS